MKTIIEITSEGERIVLYGLSRAEALKYIRYYRRWARESESGYKYRIAEHTYVPATAGGLKIGDKMEKTEEIKPEKYKINRCPLCRYTNTYYRTRTLDFLCRKCGYTWAKPSAEGGSLPAGWQAGASGRNGDVKK